MRSRSHASPVLECHIVRHGSLIKSFLTKTLLTSVHSLFFIIPHFLIARSFSHYCPFSTQPKNLCLNFFKFCILKKKLSIYPLTKWHIISPPCRWNFSVSQKKKNNSMKIDRKQTHRIIIYHYYYLYTSHHKTHLYKLKY